MNRRQQLHQSPLRMWFLGPTILLLLLSGCLGRDESLLEPEQAACFLADNNGNASVLVLDVRTPSEFTQEHLAGAQNVDFRAPDFQDRLADFDRTSTLFLYCRSGNRSARARRMAQQMGFTRVFDLDGGIVAWKKSGLPTRSGQP